MPPPVISSTGMQTRTRIMDELLRIEDAVVRYPARGAGGRGNLTAVDGVTLSLKRGETVGLVGESGCGKSSLGKAIVGLVPLASGCIRFRGDVLHQPGSRMAAGTRQHIQMIFQDPYSSLNPRMTVGQTLSEPLRAHRLAAPSEIPSRLEDLLDKVGLPSRTVSRYPHELSGGQRQRVGIARALSVEPEVIICDEAVSALDVSVQAQILNLLAGLKEKLGLSLLFISHDVGVIRHVSDRVTVMYLGQIVESAPSEALFMSPGHPYTRSLIGSLPRLTVDLQRSGPLLTGDLPDPMSPPSGCRFRTRCPEVAAICAKDQQPLISVAPGRTVRCWRASSG